MNLLSFYKIYIFSHSHGDTTFRKTVFTVYFPCSGYFCLFLRYFMLSASDFLSLPF